MYRYKDIDIKMFLLNSYAINIRDQRFRFCINRLGRHFRFTSPINIPCSVEAIDNHALHKMKAQLTNNRIALMQILLIHPKENQ